MKYQIVQILSIILLLLGMTTLGRSDLSFDDEEANRFTDAIDFEINTYPEYYFATDKYKKEKNKFSFSMRDRTGTDGEDALSTGGNAYAHIYTSGGKWEHFSLLESDNDHIPQNYTGRIQPNLKKGLPLGMYTVWEPNRWTESTAYAWASCTPDYDQYRSKYELYAEIGMEYSSDYTIRQKSKKTKTGSWSHSIFVSGSVNRFVDPTQVSGTAEADVIGRHPSKGEDYASKAYAPTTPSEYGIYCGYAEFPGASCSACSSLRTAYNTGGNP